MYNIGEIVSVEGIEEPAVVMRSDGDRLWVTPKSKLTHRDENSLSPAQIQCSTRADGTVVRAQAAKA